MLGNNKDIDKKFMVFCCYDVSIFNKLHSKMEITV